MAPENGGHGRGSDFWLLKMVATAVGMIFGSRKWWSRLWERVLAPENGGHGRGGDFWFKKMLATGVVDIFCIPKIALRHRSEGFLYLDSLK